MKKVVSIFAALLLVAISVVSAFAADVNANEKKVLDELKTSVKMQGTDMYWPDAFVNQAENYFNTIDMTAEQADKILEVIKFGKSQLEATGADTLLHNRTGKRSLYQQYFHELKEQLRADEYENLMHKNAERIFHIK